MNSSEIEKTRALLTLEKVTEWLKKQPPDREYIWQDPTYCLVGSYLRDQGSSWGYVAYDELPHYDLIAGVKPWTMGKALERAKFVALPPPVEEPHELGDRPREGELQPLLEYAGGSDQAKSG